MSTFLFTWNPNLFQWESLDDHNLDYYIEQTQKGKKVKFFDWSIGNRKTLPQGSRFFLIRLGDQVPDKGIIASGKTTSAPKDRSVEIIFDVVKKAPLIPQEYLRDNAPFSKFNWSPRASGIKLPQKIAAALEKEWEKRLRNESARPDFFHYLPTEIDQEEERSYPEGKRHQVTVNAYERNREARKECIKHYGAECSVCGFSFGKYYGQDLEGYIEVHHLKPLVECGKNYQVDPIRDLRPVCANCHAVIHRHKSLYSLDEMKRMIKGRKPNRLSL